MLSKSCGCYVNKKQSNTIIGVVHELKYMHLNKFYACFKSQWSLIERITCKKCKENSLCLAATLAIVLKLMLSFYIWKLSFEHIYFVLTWTKHKVNNWGIGSPLIAFSYPQILFIEINLCICNLLRCGLL